ncbi:UDP-glucuronosyl/UDP-glucosyltransferase protein [Dioscorea alata]|uniref:UDP-glucuronosyl/UDP-glucosyltransferase protein n=1 Tax=Dioscorea alata TaxID=55571 RepID=A0ACB7WJR2_DIOAL|nr:UDP-glucuronosyl/UDP-glucosyltransferase protein [Dioscorea alata]
MSSTTTTMKEVKKDHIMIFPFMAQGHTIPLLHLATFLSTHHHLQVTIITTSGNAPSLRRHLPSSIHLSILPFPFSPLLPTGVESTDHLPSMDLHPIFTATTTHLRPHFHHLLHSLHLSNSLPLCIISDFFLGWTLDVCRLFSIPRLVFHGMSTFSMFICKSLFAHQPHSSDNELFQIPSAPPSLLLSRHQVPDTVLNSGDPTDPVTIFLSETGAADINSWGVIVNSFSFIEREYTKLFESFYQNGARAWLLGPFSLLSPQPQTQEDDDCLQWLDEKKKKKNSVIYVSFGTQTHVTVEQLEEVAAGLEAAEYEYLWVVRDASWWLPEREFLTGERGKIVRWAPQREVLQHEAVGGFVSHCGWNSVLESMVAGVPVLTWPMMAEQALNEKMIVDELGAGLRLRKVGADGVVKREEIKDGVRELMVGEKGKRVRMKMEELGRMAMEAVEDGGSSYKSLSELIEELQRCRTNGRDDDQGLEMEKVAIDANSLLEYQDCIKIS